MDPLTHALLAACLAKSSLGRCSPLSAAALVVGALAPDLDLLLWPLAGRDAWFELHAAFTHSLPGTLLLALALVPFLGWIERLFFGRLAMFAPGGRPGTCARATVVGLLTHVPLDLLGSAGARAATPFDSAWMRADLLHPYDPYLWLLLGGGTALAGRRSVGGSLALTLAALFAWGLLLDDPATPTSLRWIFPLACLLLAWLRAAGIGRRRRGRILARTAAGVLLYICLCLAGRADALDRVQAYLAREGGETQLVGLLPTLGRPLTWHGWLRREKRVVELRIRWGEALEQRIPEQEPDHPLVRTALALEASRAFRSWARLPLGRVTPLPDGGATVELRDATREGAPWEESLRWRVHFSAEEVVRIRHLFEEEARLEGRGR